VKVEATRRFVKDFQALPEYEQKAVSDFNAALVSASMVSEIQCIKMKGSPNLYRTRLGDYRVTFCLIDNETVELRRVLTRGQIYKKHVK
jgi:mRNA-degrading endonuclease RelE of RelBE toxin-antitoxin system